MTKSTKPELNLIPIDEVIELVYQRTGYEFDPLNLVRQSRAGAFPPFARASHKSKPLFRRDDVEAWIQIAFDLVLRPNGPTIDFSRITPTEAAAGIRIKSALNNSVRAREARSRHEHV